MSGESKGRIVRVNSTDLYFDTIEALDARVEKEMRALIALDNDLLVRNPRDAAAWPRWNGRPP